LKTSAPELTLRSKARYYLLVPILSIALLAFASLTTGIRSDHIFLITIVNLSYYLTSATRRLITALGIIIVYWIIYDSMKAWPNWAFNEVDSLPLYNLEKSLFGIQHAGALLSPNEFLIAYHNKWLDLLCGMFYLGWVPLPLMFALYLYYTNKNLFLRFCMAFFIVNILGFIIYYLHPAAPPWYIAEHGPVVDVQTKSYAAGLLRVDQILDIKLFEGIYSKGSNVFAAMPSLHSSYPLIGLYYSFRQPRKFIRIIFATFMIGIWFSAVYLNHHYVLDVLAGIGCGVLGIYLFERLLMRQPTFNRFMINYENEITGRAVHD